MIGKSDFLGFRSKGLKKRIDALAKKERRTRSQMIRILVEEALNERECSEVIRQVFSGEQDDERST